MSSNQPQSAKQSWSEMMNIPVLMPHFPLGPCRTAVVPELLATVQDVLADTFQQHSVKATYCDSPAAVVCHTIDQVEFIVSLFTSKDKRIVFEIQRRCGDTVVYHRYAQHILSVIKRVGQEEHQRKSLPSFTGNQTKRCVLAAARSQNVNNNLEEIGFALENVWRALSTDRLDAQRLGLESLLILSDPTKSGFTTATAVAEQILCPKTKEGHIVQQQISKRLFAFVLQSLEKDKKGERHGPNGNLSQLGLAVVTQLFKLTAATHESCKKTMDLQLFLGQNLTDLIDNVLLPKLRAARHSPHEASYAAESLTALCGLSLPVLMASRQIEETRGELHKAHKFGVSSHSALENASQKLLVSLGA